MINHKYPVLADYTQRLEAPPLASGGYRTKGRSVERNTPLVSVVTVTFNAEKTLLRTLQSVRAQTYPNIEHIIIDGGSNDGTLDLIKANEDAIALWRSEPDRGIYDAFNKGVALAHGEYVGILNADDYYEPDQITNAVAALLRTNAPFVHGDIVMHGWKGQDVPLRGDPDYAAKIRDGMPSLFQVTVLCRMEVFRRYGLFLTRYRIASDYEWFLRLAIDGCVGAYDPRIRAHMQAGGVSTTQQRQALWEAVLIIWRGGASLPGSVWIMFPRLIFPAGMPGFVSKSLHSVRHPSAILRVMFPNGAPHFLLRVAFAIRNPAAAISLLGNYSAKRNEARQSTKSLSLEPQTLLAVFLDARQVCGTISPLGLEWLYELASRCDSFAIQASPGPEASAAKMLLSAGGAQQITDADTAHVLLIDRQHLDSVDLQQRASRQTVLLVSGGQITPALQQLTHLDFIGLTVYGLHLDPQYSAKRG